MSYCSHQMDWWMQQEVQMARSPSEAAAWAWTASSFQVHYHHPNTERCAVWGWGGSGALANPLHAILEES